METVSSAEVQEVIGLLRDRLVGHDNNRAYVQTELSNKIMAIKADLDRMEEMVNASLEEAYTAEDARLQELVYDIESEYVKSKSTNNKDSTGLAGLIERARAALSVEQTYVLEENPDAKSFSEQYSVRVERGFNGISEKKPRAVAVSFDPERGCDVVKFQFLSPEERAVLRKMGLENSVTYKALLCEKVDEVREEGDDEEEGEEEEIELEVEDEEEEEEETVILSDSGSSSCGEEDGGDYDSSADEHEGNMDLRAVLKAGATYRVRVQAECGGRASVASEATEFTATFAECCAWRTCPPAADAGIQYTVDGANPRIATKTRDDYFAMRHSTIVGSAELPRGARDVAWGVRVLKSGHGGKAAGIHIGVIPADVDQCAENYLERGWFLDCHTCTLWTGRPRITKGKAYGPRKGKGKYVAEGDVVGVTMDMTTGTLSFVVGGVCLGAAFTGIPLGTPLVPCVLLAAEGDSVELVGGAAAAERHSSAIPTPRNIRVMGGETWNKLNIYWDSVEGADFYQVETEGSAVLEATTARKVVKEGLSPETVMTFRVRAVHGGAAGPWSEPVRGKTLKAPVAPACAWRECPGTVAEERKYVLAPGNPRIATCAGGEDTLGCTVVGATALPQGVEKVSWEVKIASSCDDDGYGIRVGVAPVDIDQNGDSNQEKCGWFLDCWSSMLWSSSPSGAQKVRGKQYGPHKGKGKYVAEGDVVGVSMDMAKGTMSFSINGVDLGVAFEGIPLDEKPLVPCVLMCCEDDSVEIVLSQQ